MRTGLGGASTTVHGICCPSALKIWVIPTFLPMIPIMGLLDLDLDVDTGRQIQLGERVDRLGARIEDVDHALVRLQLELLARLLVDVRRAQHRPPLRLRRQRDRPRHLLAGLLGRAHNVSRRLIDHRVIEGLETDANSTSHGDIPNPYFKILVTTPAPTVRPPSRIANRSPSSIAIGVISSIVICTLSPGITISIPAGSSTDPVTSVVRK